MGRPPPKVRFPPTGPDWAAFSGVLLAATFEGEFSVVTRCYAGKGGGALRLVTRDFRCWHFSDTNALGGSSDNRSSSTRLLVFHRQYRQNRVDDPRVLKFASGVSLAPTFMAVDDYAALASWLSIRLRSTSKSMGLVSSASAPPANAFRSVSASP